MSLEIPLFIFVFLTTLIYAQVLLFALCSGIITGSSQEILNMSRLSAT